jgi:hypothetical protein
LKLNREHGTGFEFLDALCDEQQTSASAMPAEVQAALINEAAKVRESERSTGFLELVSQNGDRAATFDIKPNGLSLTVREQGAEDDFGVYIDPLLMPT